MGLKYIGQTSSGADIFDDFNRTSGNLAGMETTRGGRNWGGTRQGGSAVITTTIPGVSVNRVRATGNNTSGNYAIVVNPDRMDKTTYAQVAALSSNPVPSLITRVVDAENHYAMTLRSGDGTPEYAFFRRIGDDNQFILKTGVVPKVGDRMQLHNIGGVIRGEVNGRELFSVAASSFPNAPHTGFNFNGVDIVTAFDNFGVYLR